MHVLECMSVASKDFPCKDCDLKWASGPMLNIHLKTDHFYERMYTCDICGLCLLSKHKMDTHVKDHDKKEEQCSECQLKCSSSKALKRHLWDFHKIGSLTEECLCKFCGQTVIGRNNLSRHEREKHGSLHLTK